jgi:hypothetical protein
MHISKIEDKRAVALALVDMPDDAYHNRIKSDARALVLRGMGYVRYLTTNRSTCWDYGEDGFYFCREEHPVELTELMMDTAHWASCLDVYYDGLPEQDRALAWATEVWETDLSIVEIKEIQEHYALGKAVLEEYDLSYTQRFRMGLDPDMPAGAQGTLRVDAGYIASTEAYRLAIFRKRQTGE